MRPHRLSLLLAVTLACVLTGPGTRVANAYVRRTSETGKPLGWPSLSRTIAITGYSQGLDDMSLDQITAAMTSAAEPWTKADPALAECTDLALDVQVVGVDQAPPAVANDNNNIIAVRHDAWNTMVGHEAMALALTSVYFYRSTGQIVGADVEVNAVDFHWADVTMDPTPGLQDLQNALTHELGHFIGLDHSCYLGTTAPPNEIDEMGNPVPGCSSLAARTEVIADSTMYPSTKQGETDLRTLSPNDQKAVCDIYPLGQATLGIVAMSATSGGCSCEVGPSLSGGGAADARGGSAWQSWMTLGFGVLACGGVALARRPRRRRTRPTSPLQRWRGRRGGRG